MNDHPDVVQERYCTDISPRIYDLQVPPDSPDVALWTEWCRQAGGPVLELGCGTGRISVPLGRAGLQVVGIDLAAAMLRAARRRVAAEEPEVRARVRFLAGDMRGPLPRGPFGCVIIPARTFLLLVTRDDQEHMLSAVRDVLGEGGQLAFDLPVLARDWRGIPGLRPPVRRTSADGEMDFTEERTVELDPAARIGTTISSYTFHRPHGLGRITERSRWRMLERDDVIEVIGASGYKVEALWGDYRRGPLTEESRMMIFVARRR